MLKAVIIDDEEDARVVLKTLIDKYCPAVEIIAMVDSVGAAEILLNKESPDILFLDIEMPGGSGFDLLEKFINKNWAVIFTTAHDQYALKAIRCSAVDYLLKPIIVKELVEAIEKVEKQQGESQSENVKALLSNKKEIKKIGLFIKGQLVFREVDEILYCEADSNYTIVHTNKGESITASKTLKDYENLLGEVSFYRVHHSFLINMKHVKHHSALSESVIMSNGMEIAVSRRKKTDFINMYQKIYSGEAIYAVYRRKHSL